MIERLPDDQRSNRGGLSRRRVLGLEGLHGLMGRERPPVELDTDIAFGNDHGKPVAFDLPEDRNTPPGSDLLKLANDLKPLLPIVGPPLIGAATWLARTRGRGRGTRGDFLAAGAATALSEVALTAACSPGQPEPTPVPPTPDKPTPTPKPTEIPNSFEGKVLDRGYLTTHGALLKGAKPESQPQPTPIAEKPQRRGPDEAMVEYARQVFYREKIDFDDPLDVIRFAIAQGPRAGTDGGVTYFKEAKGQELALAGLSLYRETLNIEKATGKKEYVCGKDYSRPQELVLHDGGGITIVGRTGNGVVIAFEEYFKPSRRPTDTVNPRMRLAVVAVTELDKILKEFNCRAKYDASNPDVLIYQDNGSTRTVHLNTITDEISSLISAEAGAVWVEKYPTKVVEHEVTENAFFPEPVVPFPPQDVLAQAKTTLDNLDFTVRTDFSKTGSTRSVMVLAKDRSTGDLVMMAKYNDKSQEWKWGEPTLRDLGEILGVNFGTTVDGAERWNDPRYKAAVAEHFGAIMPSGAFLETAYAKWGRGQAEEFRKRATEGDQTFYIHPGFWHQFLPEELKTASREQIVAHAETLVRTLLGYVNQNRDGGKPTLINFTNEPLWVNPETGAEEWAKVEWKNAAGGQSEWAENPYHRAFGNDMIAELYLLFARIAREKGLQIGRDVRLVYNDFNIHSRSGAGTKTGLVLRELDRAKSQIAARLGQAKTDVQLDVGIQCHFFYKDRPSYLVAPPTEDELSATIQLFQQTLGDKSQVHLTEVNPVGTSQADTTATVNMVNRVAVKTRCAGVHYWYPLRFLGEGDTTGNPYYNPKGWFTGSYQSTDEYRRLVHDLVQLAEDKGLV